MREDEKEICVTCGEPIPEDYHFSFCSEICELEYNPED